MENCAIKFNYVETENLAQIFDFLEKNVSKKYETIEMKTNINNISLLDSHNCKIILPKIYYKKTSNYLKGKIKKTFSAKKDFLVKL